MSRGRIEKALSGFYYVNTGAETLQCRARGKFRREGMSPLVGDWVQVRDLGGGEGFVEAVEPRRNVFSRPAAANIDQLVILASAAIPVTEPYLIDRIAAIAALKGCQVLLCLNKCDLNTADELYDIYSHSALPVLRISAETGEGLAALRAAIAGKLNAFTGNSGVGKSSVLNRLLPELHLPAGEADGLAPTGEEHDTSGRLGCILPTLNVTGSEEFSHCARHFFAGILTYFKKK